MDYEVEVYIVYAVEITRRARQNRHDAVSSRPPRRIPYSLLHHMTTIIPVMSSVICFTIESVINQDMKSTYCGSH